MRKLTTRVLHKALTMRRNDDTLLALLLRSEVVASLARGVSDEEISVSQHAADALVELMRQSRQASADHSSVIMAVIREVSTEGEMGEVDLQTVFESGRMPHLTWNALLTQRSLSSSVRLCASRRQRRTAC